MESDSPIFHEDFLFKEILPKLGTKSLIALKSVSKSWLARITGDSTFKAHHAAYHQSEDCKIMGAEHRDENHKQVYKLFCIGPRSSELVEIDTTCVPPGALSRQIDDLYLIGCGNGLICLLGFFQDSSGETCEFVVWNPVTKEFKCLPLPSAASFHPSAARVAFYFGVGKRRDDFKVLCLSEIMRGIDFRTKCIHVHVFSRSSGSWRQLNCSLLGFELVRNNRMSLGQALTLDGTMYWAIRYVDPVGGQQISPFHILSFDLCAENFEELEGPPVGLIGETFVFKELIEWKGHLGAVLTNDGLTEWQFLIKINSAWTKMTTVDPSYQPLQYLGSLGTRLILGNSGAPKSVLYNVTSRETSELRDNLVEIRVICGHNHTLLSPN